MTRKVELLNGHIDSGRKVVSTRRTPSNTMASTALLAPKCGACKLSTKSVLNSSNAEASTQVMPRFFSRAAMTPPGLSGSKRLCRIRPLQGMGRETTQSHGHRCGVRAQAAPSSGVAEDVREDE